MRDEAKAGRLEVLSGRGDAETWEDVSGSSLPRNRAHRIKTVANGDQGSKDWADAVTA